VAALDMLRFVAEREAARVRTASSRARRLRAVVPELASLLVRKHRARRVWLFGSLVAGSGHARSDIDLAVEGLGAADYFKALADLGDAAPCRVDLVRIEDVDEAFRDRIVREGELLVDRA